MTSIIFDPLFFACSPLSTATITGPYRVVYSTLIDILRSWVHLRRCSVPNFPFEYLYVHFCPNAAQAEAAGGPPTNASAIFSACLVGLKMGHEKHTHRGAPTRVGITANDSKVLQQLTEADAVLYGMALRRFHGDLSDIGHPMAWFRPSLPHAPYRRR